MLVKGWMWFLLIFIEKPGAQNEGAVAGDHGALCPSRGGGLPAVGRKRGRGPVPVNAL